MDVFSAELNNVIIDTFRSILKVEEKMLQQSGKHGLSISEVHLIEAVGKGKNEPKTIGRIAQYLGVTPASVTVAVNKLAEKGYLSKMRAAEDARSVNVSLTRLGQGVDRMHAHFHEKMVRGITDDMTELEKQVLLQGAQKLNRYFLEQLND